MGYSISDSDMSKTHIISSDNSVKSDAKFKPKHVTEDETEMRLDRWFKRHFPDLNHGQLEKLLRGGQIRVDGKRALANMRLATGQAIRIPPLLAHEHEKSHKHNASSGHEPPLGLRQSRLLKELQQRILFMDDWVIALDKPAGLAVQGGTGTPHHLDGMLDYFRYGMDERPRLVHRLDRETSGVLLLARTRRAAVILSKTWQMRQSEKLYWAIVAGVPKIEDGEIDDIIAKSVIPDAEIGGEGGLGAGRGARRGGGRKFIKHPQHAISHYRVLDKAAQHAAWLELRPLTGRTHQLRLHCLALNCPILGDSRYGGSTSFLSGLAHDRILHLYARSLHLPHPAGKGEISVTASPPPHMVATARLLGFALTGKRHDSA